MYAFFFGSMWNILFESMSSLLSATVVMSQRCSLHMTFCFHSPKKMLTFSVLNQHWVQLVGYLRLLTALFISRAIFDDVFTVYICQARESYLRKNLHTD
jgi:hypothetical protein